MQSARTGLLIFLFLTTFAGNTERLHAEGTNDWIPELTIWGYSVELRASGGYRDNLLLDKFKQESSYYLSAGSDLTIWRLPIDRHQFFFLASGDYFRYPEANELDDEANAVAMAQYKNLLTPSLEFSGIMQYSYVDQVMGLITETNFNPIPVLAHITGWRPSLRKYLTSEWWVELEGYGSRQLFESPLDDLWEMGPRLLAGRDYGQNSVIQWTYQYTHRLYDNQKALQANGTPMDLVLRTDQHEWNASWNHYWGSQKRWRNSTQGGLQLARDNGSGFFDFNRYHIRDKISYRTSSWEVEGQARLSYYDFLVQRSEGPGSSKSQKTLLGMQFKVSRKLVKNVNVFLQYEYEESLSNRDDDDYASNKFGAGVDWEF